ncbi:MAG: DUF2750 domain-containing protein [Myxococcota bacterium]
MTWELNAEELRAVLARDAEQRYRYFLTRVVEEQAVYGLFDDGWALLRDERGRELFPVWPHPRYAQRFAKNEWQGCRAREIDLKGLFDRWLPSIQKQDRRIAVFPISTRTHNDLGVSVRAKRLEYDLSEALQDNE